MKSIVVAWALAIVAAFATLPTDALAKRIGGGGSAGMQRSVTPRAAPEALPARPATAAAQQAPAPAAAAAPVVAPKRSWLGPIAGLAAGLGIAALMSHFGLGAEFGNIVMLLLLAALAVFVIRFVMRRLAAANAVGPRGLQLAGAAGSAGSGFLPPSSGTPAAELPSTLPAIPTGFDSAGFERVAKLMFIRMQAANDSADLNDLRNFTTPEMFAAVRLDLQERGAQLQRTDVVRIDAEVLEVASEPERQIVSVRFHGLIREEIEGDAQPFDEVWHLVKPADGSREWAIAGIQQSGAPLAQAA